MMLSQIGRGIRCKPSSCRTNTLQVASKLERKTNVGCF
nr:MAG TPA: hypothetical protein [Caudoviricetes sp.]